jgi:hypothetical protein
VDAELAGRLPQPDLAGELVGLLGLAVATLVGCRLRFRPWSRRGPGSAAPTASGAPPAVGRLARDGYVVSTTWPCPARPPMWIISSSGRSGCSSSTPSSGLAASTRAPTGWSGTTTIRWIAPRHRALGGDGIGRALGTRTAALLCVHGENVQDGGLDAQGVAIAPARLLRSALGYDRVLSDADVELLATTRLDQARPGRLSCPAQRQRTATEGANGARMAVVDRLPAEVARCCRGWFGWWRLAPGGQYGRADLLGGGALGDKGARSGLAGDDPHPGALSGGEHHHLDLG